MRSRLLQAIGFGLVLLFISGALLLTPIFKRSIQAQRADLLAAAARYPKFTREQRLAVLRARQFELHPTWRDLSLAQAAQRLIRLASQVVSPTQPMVANFLGNTTTIGSPAGTAVALARQSNCSLTLLSGTYTISFTTPGYTITNTTPSYEQVLHAEAYLNTTPDQFVGGCPDPKLGLTATRAVYVGKTSSGLNIFGAYVYDAAANNNEVYSVVSNGSFAYQSSTELTTGATPVGVLTADFNNDGNGDLVSINNSLAAGGTPTVSIFLGNADGSFQPATDAALPGTEVLSAVIDDFNNDGKSDIVASTETLPPAGGTPSLSDQFSCRQRGWNLSSSTIHDVCSPHWRQQPLCRTHQWQRARQRRQRPHFAFRHSAVRQWRWNVHPISDPGFFQHAGDVLLWP